jgi:hypothetical protein
VNLLFNNTGTSQDKEKLKVLGKTACQTQNPFYLIEQGKTV